MRRALIIIGYLIVLGIFIFSLIPGSGGEGMFPHSDKLGHAFVYFLVTFWFSNLYPREEHKWLVVKFSLQGILIEFLQRMTGYRTFDYFDMLANFTGCLIAFIIASRFRNAFKALLNPDSP